MEATLTSPERLYDSAVTPIVTRDDIVAVLIPLDDRKKDLLPLLVPRWDAIDYGGRNAFYILGCTDASQETIDLFCSLTNKLYFLVGSTDEERDDIKRSVWAYDHINELPGNHLHHNIIFLHKMAMIREQLRVAALSEVVADQVGGKPGWYDWKDQDIDDGHDSFLRRHAILTETTGPLRPRVACGLYCTRYEGADILGSMQLPLTVDSVQTRDVAGFGCALMDREVMENVGWESYGRYRAQRAWKLELNRSDTGVLGEDVFWFCILTHKYGLPPLVDSGVLCKHYHSDGSYWYYEEMPNGTLKSRYNTDNRMIESTIGVKNIGLNPIKLDEFDFTIQPGGIELVSPEQRDKFFEFFHESVEEVSGVGITRTSCESLDGSKYDKFYSTFESIHHEVLQRYKDGDGWCNPEEARVLYDLSSISPGVVVEIGTYKGLSTCYLAARADRVYAFDPYLFDDRDGSDIMCEARKIWGELGILSRITQYRMSSPGCSSKVPDDSVIGLVFVDGLHTYDGCLADLQAWAKRVREGGFLILHDYVNLGESQSAGVKKAADEALTVDDWELLRIVHSMAIFRKKDQGGVL